MRVVVVGSAIVDVIARPASIVRGDTSNEAGITLSAGGAGRNVAESLARLGASVTLVTDLADDVPGRFLLENMRGLGLEVRLCGRERTGIYLAVLDPEGGLDRGFCQTGTEHVGVAEVDAVLPDLDAFDGAVIDANLGAGVIEALAARCRRAGLPYALETVAHERSLRVAGAIPGCAFIKPDRGEAEALTGRPCGNAAEALACAEDLVARGARRVVVSLGPDGLVFAGDGQPALLPALPTAVADVTGAGDAMLSAAFLGLLRGMPPARYLEAGRRAAALACAWRGAVSPALDPHSVFGEAWSAPGGSSS
jgi:pseudouridine kinase